MHVRQLETAPPASSKRRIKRARWQAHAAGLALCTPLWNWISDHDSLTRRLSAHSARFRVQRLYHRSAAILADEAPALGLSTRARVMERDVLLFCDEQAVVFAHTVMALGTSRSDWPYVAGLGNRSIGNRLFNDPAVVGGKFEFARLHPRHPLMVRAAHALDRLGANADSPDGATRESTMLQRPLYARRRVFRRKQGLLMITEVFLDCPMWTGP